MKNNENIYPLSSQQSRLWFLSQKNPESPVWNNFDVKHLKGKLNISYLKRAFVKLVNRHPVLKNEFYTFNNQPYQRVNKIKKPILTYIDLSCFNSVQSEQEARRISQREINTPFNLTNDNLYRSILIKLEEQKYVFMLIVHHIISDGKSLEIYWNDLSEFYNFYNGMTINLEKINYQYKDYVIWQRDVYNKKYFKKEETYWFNQFNDYKDTMNLPYDYEKQSIHNYSGTRYYRILNSNLSKNIQVFSFRNRMVSYSAYIATFYLLLQRYSQQNDLVIGSAFAGREFDTRLNNIFGYFVNTVALRMIIPDDVVVLDFAKQVNKMVNDAYDMQYYPLERLVKYINPKRNASLSPLYNVMFNMIHTGDFMAKDIEEEWCPQYELKASQVDLTITVINSNKKIEISFEYRPDLFKRATIRRMMEHYVNLLEEVTSNPERCLNELSMLSEEEINKILIEWNDTAAEYPKDKCIHELFETQVEKTPDAVAMIFEEEQISYRELNRRANQLACFLIEHGAGTDITIGICLNRSLEMVIGILGILKVGGIYVPIDPQYPKERIAFILSDSQIPILLTQDRYADYFSKLEDIGLEATNCMIICLDLKTRDIFNKSDEPLSRVVTGKKSAYMIYTSGSTGIPKGVIGHHEGLCNLVTDQSRRIGLKENSTVLQFASSGFDASIWEVFMTLCSGAKLNMASKKSLLSGPQIENLINDHMITHLLLPPSVLALVNPHKIVTVQSMIVGGEICPKDYAINWYKKMRFFNAYGPTESTVISSMAEYSRISKFTIGKPISNTQIFILGHQLQLVPSKISGEIYIGGIGISYGYFNRPQLTSEKFIPNPYSRNIGDRLYKSGDLASYMTDGNIDFIGRIDNQVKIRGYRIELGEIESLLSAYPGMNESVVLMREDVHGDKRLVAYIVSSVDQKHDIAEIRDFLKKKLPDYMIPSAYVMLDEMPLTPNGKIDRKSLSEPERSGLEKDYVTPSTEIEQELADIWCDVLGIEKVGINDNFFEIGGHSLIAFQLLSRINNKFSISMQIDVVFEIQTIAELAFHIEYKLKSGTNVSIPDKNYNEFLF